MNLVVKDNSLINASYSLSLVEQRLILLAIIEAREYGKGIDTQSFLEIHAQHYADKFNIQLNNAYAVLSEATQTLFNRQVTYLTVDEKRNKLEKRVVRWVSGISYIEGAGVIKLRFAPEIIPLITRLEKNFTSYELEQVKNLNSHATRLYEILISWRNVGKIKIGLEDLRQNLGLVNEYRAMSDFKKRVLDTSIEQINEHTDITVEYDQHKQGRTITSFTFKFKQKDKLTQVKAVQRNLSAIDNTLTRKIDTEARKTLSWQLKGLTEKQINKIAIYKKDFIDANTSKISPNDSRSYDEIFENWKPQLKDPKVVNTFNKVQELLERQKI